MMKIPNHYRPLRSVDVIIVTHQSKGTILSCIGSVQKELRSMERFGLQFKVIVVDCGSQDATPEYVESILPREQVHRLPNLGFAGGCNHGLLHSTADAVLFLNPDTLVEEGSLRALVDHLELNPRVGAVGPQLRGLDGRRAVSSQRFPSLRGELRRTFDWIGRRLGIPRDDEGLIEAKVDWVPGACMLVRRCALDAVGGFDTRFFLYFEEVDWCLRARQAGFETHLCRRADVVHIGGASVGAGDSREEHGGRAKRHDAHHKRSRTKYFLKHHGFVRMMVVEALHSLWGLSVRLRDGRFAL